MKAVSHIFVAFVVFGFASCEVRIKSNDKPEKLEKGRMVGIDTVHDIPINKDTIITRNFIDNSKLDWKNGRKGGIFLYLLLQLYCALLLYGICVTFAQPYTSVENEISIIYCLQTDDFTGMERKLSLGTIVTIDRCFN